MAGMYDRYLTGDIKTNYRRALEEVDQIDLSGELALIRSKLGEVVEKLGEATDDPKVENRNFARMERLVKEVRQLSGTVGKNIELSASYMPISFLPILLHEIVETLRKEIGNDNIVEKLKVRLNSISLPANGAEARRVARIAGNEGGGG